MFFCWMFFCCSRFVWFVLFCFVLFWLLGLFVCLFVCFFVSLFLCFLIEYSTNSKSAVNGIFDELMILAPFFPSIVSKQNLRKFDPIILWIILYIYIWVGGARNEHRANQGWRDRNLNPLYIYIHIYIYGKKKGWEPLQHFPLEKKTEGRKRFPPKKGDRSGTTPQPLTVTPLVLGRIKFCWKTHGVQNWGVDFFLNTKVQLDSDSFWHLGGFCFGHSREDPEVALLKGRVEWDGQVPLHKAQVYVAGTVNYCTLPGWWMLPEWYVDERNPAPLGM